MFNSSISDAMFDKKLMNNNTKRTTCHESLIEDDIELNSNQTMEVLPEDPKF